MVEDTASNSTEKDERRWESWFWENTYHHSDFSELDLLLQRKQEQEVSISVGIPTLNEEETIGDIVDVIQGQLIDRTGLVDELVVIDSDSSDNTRSIAQEKGATVYNAVDYRERTGFNKGKGVNLWLSLHLMEGDLICWVDGDIENFESKFIYGLLGPILFNDEVSFSKAFYERPIKISGELKPSGGGRVTELTARPLLNMFFPELSYFIQPLSGEYAGTRSTLESIPFFPDYGVEVGLLIDIAHYHGLNRIAQVDLDQRVHHNKPLSGLRKMAFRILQVVLLRARQRDRISADLGESEVLNLLGQKGKDLVLEKYKSEIEEKPPISEHSDSANESTSDDSCRR